jgi:allantoicase
MTEPVTPDGRPAFTALPDLASRLLGGGVVYANDELFAAKENLVKPGRPEFAAGEFGPRGKIYDGWETRRRRTPGHDHAIVRLGASGEVHGVIVDTAWFRGNYPPHVSVEAVTADGYPSPDELAGLDWQPLVPPTSAGGDRENFYPVTDQRRRTHVRLSIYPDGGVARLRVHGRAVPDPRFLTGLSDLLALENGAEVTGCSDQFYGSAGQLILPGRPRSMADGWENARRRGPGCDWVSFRLGLAGTVRQVEVDTSWFVGNAPGRIRLLATADPALLAAGPRAGAVPGSAVPGGPPAWWDVLPEQPVQPDTRHRFLATGGRPAAGLRLEVYPDGGLARLRAFGEPSPQALAAAWDRWQQ